MRLEVNLFILNVSKFYREEDSILSLSPFDLRVTSWGFAEAFMKVNVRRDTKDLWSFFFYKAFGKLTCEPFAKGVSITINDRVLFFVLSFF